MKDDSESAASNSSVAQEGVIWQGLARTVVLGMLDQRHDDIDGRSLATEPWYHFELDTFATNTVLAGRPTASFLVRLSAKNGFVVSVVKLDGSIAHIGLTKKDSTKGIYCFRVYYVQQFLIVSSKICSRTNFFQ